MMNTFCLAVCAVSLMLPGMAAQGEEFDSAGVRIHYTVQGTGEPVILIHGLYSSSRMNWELPGTSALLAKHFQVIAMDCRGHGLSDKPEAEGAYGTNMVGDVVRLMDHLKISKSAIVGYSMGGMIAVKLTCTYPDRVSRVVLGGMGWHKANAPMNSVWDSVQRDRFTVPAACAHGFPALAVTEAEVKGIKVPLTMIVGAQDPCRKWYVEPMHELRPEWPVHVIEGAGHLNCVTKPEFKVQLEAALEK
jgi:pimeloyl-ACP methyl ester carboxylesterase